MSIDETQDKDEDKKVDIVDFEYINLYIFSNKNVHHSLRNRRYKRYCIGINL